MQNPQVQLGQFLEGLHKQLRYIDRSLKTFEYLQECQTDNRSDAIDTASLFFQVVHNALLIYIIVNLLKFYDSKSQTSIFHYLHQVKAHFGSLNIYQNLLTPQDIDLHTHQLSQLNFDNLTRQRNKYYAHIEPKYFYNPHQIVSDAPLNTADIQQLIDVPNQIFEQHFQALKGIDLFTDEPTDVQNVINTIIHYAEITKRQDFYEWFSNTD